MKGRFVVLEFAAPGGEVNDVFLLGAGIGVWQSEYGGAQWFP